MKREKTEGPNLTREQADKLAQRLANETEEPQIVWWDSEQPRNAKARYQVVSAKEASAIQLGHQVDLWWPMETG